MTSQICLISGRSNLKLANDISNILEISLDPTEITNFSDGEIFVRLGSSVRGKQCFVIQSTAAPANENIMELLIIIDALKRSAAGSINVIMPYYGYSRQDRKMESRTPISAKLVADLLEKTGVHHIVCMDLHVGQIQGFFSDIACDNVYVIPELAKYVMGDRKSLKNTTVVSPDVGGVARARKFAATLKCPLAIIDKRRPKANVAEVMNLIGEVNETHAIIVDDMVDTGGSLCKASDALLNNGALSVTAVCAHGILSGNAITTINNSKLSKLIITDTISQSTEVINHDKIEIVTIAPLLAEVIRRIRNGESLNGILH